MAGKSEYPRVGSHHSLCVHKYEAVCDMCAAQIPRGVAFWKVDIITHRFKGSVFTVVLCDKCWHKHRTGAILEWWLEQRK